jgi:hypothetical protein
LNRRYTFLGKFPRSLKGEDDVFLCELNKFTRNKIISIIELSDRLMIAKDRHEPDCMVLIGRQHDQKNSKE